MALVLKDRVRETSTTTGTGSFTLSGAPTGYQTFSSAIGNTNTTYYTIQNGSEWEVGIGTVSAGALSRDTVLASSTGAKVSFSAGTKDVFCTYPASKSVYADASGYVSGYTIENSTIGATTASTGKFTSVTTPSVTASSTDLTLSAISTGAVKFSTAGGLQMQIADKASAVDYLQITGGAATQAAVFFTTQGTDTNIGYDMRGKGAGTYWFSTGSAFAPQMTITNTASAVNYVQVTGGATGTRPSLTVAGSDATIGLNIAAKGGEIVFLNNGVGTNAQFSTTFTAASVNYLTATGSGATGNAPRLYAQGSDTNISMAFQPKGTGAIDLAAGSSGVNISNGGTVTAITRTAAGTGYTSPPTVTISAPTTAGGVQATATIPLQIALATIATAGSGYAVNDTITLVGGTGTATTFTVASLSGSGVATLTVTNNGSYSVVPSNPVATTTSGAGTGLTINMTWGIQNTFTITNAGSGYIEQPTVTFSGGGGSGAAAYASVGSTATVKGLYGGNSQVAIQFSTAAGGVLKLMDGGTTATPTSLIIKSGNGGTQLYPDTANSQTYISSSGTGFISFQTNTLAAEQLRVSHTASAVNFVQVTGAATGQPPAITAQGSDSNVNMTLRSKGTGYIGFTSGGGSGILLGLPNGSANYFTAASSNAGSAPILAAAGSDTNIDLSLTTKGTGNIVGNVNSGTFTLGRDSSNNAIKFTAPNGNLYLQSTGGGVILFNTGDGTPNQMRVAHTASAVNYVQVTGSATGGNPAITVQGSDATRGLAFSAKGNANINFFNNNLSNNIFVISGNAGTIANYLQATASVAGTATSLQAQGSDTNIDLALTPKGTGGVAINSAIKLGSGLSAGTSGQVLTSAGAGASPTWSSAGTGGMTLLGTITPTAANSISLGSLTLTSYKSLYIVFNGISGSSSKLMYISSSNIQTGGGLSFTDVTTANSGTAWLDLGTSAIGGNIGANTVTATSIGGIAGLTNVTTSSTIVYFRFGGTSTFTAAGSIVIYGVS